MGKKKNKRESAEIKDVRTKFTGSRHLKLSEALNKDFNSIKEFKNFQKWFFHKYYHAFYSLSIAYSAEKLLSTPDTIKESKFEETQLVKEDDVAKPSIESTQLTHHDNLFKTIAYWYLLQKGVPKPYMVLIDPNLARRICEGFFIENWKDFRRMISELKSTYPNVDIAKIVEDT